MKAQILFIAAPTLLSACSMKQEKAGQATTIDSTLQAKVTSILENKLEELDAQSGQVIVMEVQSGQIKALVGLERSDCANCQEMDRFCTSQIDKDGIPASGGAMAGSVFGEIAEYMADTANMGKSANDIRFGDWKDSDWLDNEYIRTLRNYLDDYNAGKACNSDLDPYKEQIGGKFVVYSMEPYLLGGAFIQIAFLEMPNRVFGSWIYSDVDEKRGTVESYEFRSIRIEEEPADMTKEEILQAVKETDGLKLW